MKNLILVMLSIFFLGCEKQENKMQEEFPSSLKSLVDLTLSLNNYNKGIYNWKEKEVINSLIEITSDTILQSIRSEPRIILLGIKYLNYSDSVNILLEVKGSNKYKFIAYNEELEIENLRKINSRTNKYMTNKVWSRGKKLEINDSLSYVAQMNTEVFYLKFGCLFVNTLISLE
jgi:hypothetical protein